MQIFVVFMSIKALQDGLKDFFLSKGCTSSTAIASLVGMEQSTVYRSLYQDRPKLTRGLVFLCNYAEFNAYDYMQNDPASNQQLMETLSLVWNGTDAHAKQLSRLLLTAHSCKLNGRRI